MAETTYHKQDPSYRVVQFGKAWFVQRKSDEKPAKDNDPWQSIGKTKDTYDEAVQAMYVFKPLRLP